jgi:hypothetical protein
MIVQNFAADAVLTLSSGSYAFASFELEATAAGNILLDNSAVTSIATGNLTIDLRSTGTVTINDGTTTDWIITGDVIDQRDFDLFTWNKSANGTLTYGGGYDVDIDLMEQSYTDVIVDKDGIITFHGEGTFDSFDGVDTGSGFCAFDDTVDITTIGDTDWRAAFDTDSGAADNFNGISWEVGGNWTADGQTFNADSTWFLQVDGSADASGTGTVEYCDAVAGNVIQALPWTDGDNNTNWRFVEYPYSILPAMTGGMMV